MTRFGAAIFFVGKEGSNPLKTIMCYVFLIFFYLVTLLGWQITYLSPQGLPRQPNDKKNHQDNLNLFGHLFYT